MEKEQIFGLIRHALTIIGGGMVAKGYLTEDGLDEVYGATMALFGVIWSYVAKMKQKGLL
jgi:hypothetical protein